MSKLRLQTALTVLPVLSAGLYLMGNSYYQGYLDEFGLEDSLFPLATEKSLLSGFFALVNIGFAPMMYTVAAIVALVFAVLIAAVLSSNPRVKHWQEIVRAKIRSWRPKNEPSPTMNNLVDKGTTIYGYSVGVFLGVLLLLVVVLASTKSGREHANKEKEAFRDQKGNYVTIEATSLPGPTRAKLIICSPALCAFWLGGETRVIRHEDIERLVMHHIPKNATQ